MLLSGGVAGLIWMPALFGDAHSYGPTFQAGLGFTGIAVALLGRNQPVGIVFGAVLFAFLNEQSNPLRFETDISHRASCRSRRAWSCSAVVIAYEVVRRYRDRLEQSRGRRDVGREQTIRRAGGGDGMSAASRRLTLTVHPAQKSPDFGGMTGYRWWLTISCSAWSCCSVIRVVTGADDIDSTGTLRAAVIATCPILMAGIGGLWAERAGVVNIGLEGQMILGTLGRGVLHLLVRPVGRASSARRCSARSAGCCTRSRP